MKTKTKTAILPETAEPNALEAETFVWVGRQDTHPIVWHAVIYESSLQIHTACDQLFPLTGNVKRSGQMFSQSRQRCLFCLRSLAAKVQQQAGRTHD